MYQDAGKKIGQYYLIQGIGRGSYAKVYKATKQNLDQIYAIKVVDKKQFIKTPVLQKLIQSEQNVMANAYSQNVLKIYQKMQYNNKIYLVLEYCNQSNLEQHLIQNSRIHQTQAIAIFKQILNGILALHKNLVIHRDLKPDNILKKDGIFKIGDLGFARILLLFDQTTDTFLGTPSYMAPEIIKGLQYSTKVDIWSLGVILYRMIFGKLPYNYKTSIRQSMKKTLQNQSIEFPFEISPGLLEIIKGCLEIDPQKRINWKQLMSKSILNEQQLIVSKSVNSILTNIPSFKSIQDIEKKNETEPTQISQQPRKPLKSIKLTQGQNEIILGLKRRDSLMQRYKKMQKIVKQCQQNCKRIIPEKIKIFYLLQNVVKIKSKHLLQQFQNSRRLLELRLIVANHCVTKTRYIIQIFQKKSNYTNFNIKISEFQYFQQFCKSYQLKVLLNQFKLLFQTAFKLYNQISEKLRHFQDKFTHILKDNIFKMLNKDKSFQKQVILQGIPALDYDNEAHIKYTLKFIRDEEVGIVKKIRNKISACKQVYHLSCALANYEKLTNCNKQQNEKTVKMILESYEKTARYNVDWRQLIDNQLRKIE